MGHSHGLREFWFRRRTAIMSRLPQNLIATSTASDGGPVSKACRSRIATQDSSHHNRRVVHHLTDLAQQTDRGIVLAESLVEMLRQQRIVLPALDVIERVCGEALTRGTRQVYKALTVPLADHHRHALDGVLANRDGSQYSVLTWLRESPGAPKPKHILAHLERLKILRELLVPNELEHAVHHNHCSGELMRGQLD